MELQPVSSQTLQSTDITTMTVVEEDPMKPRRLTEQEIRDIISVVPDLKSATEETSQHHRESMLKTLREQFREVMVTPLSMDFIKEEVLRQFNESLIKPGEVVGVTAAEALGQPITQMALNSFHQSGSSKNVTYGVDRIRELINASENIKTTSCSIFFKNQNMSFDDVVIKVRPEITEVKISDIVKGIPDIESSDGLDEPWWYGSYRTLIRNDFKSSSILRLEFDVDLMYAYKITMEDVAKVIEKDQSVVCVYSPLNIGKAHVYPNEKAVASRIKGGGIIDRKNAPMIFLWEAVIPSLDVMKIQGVAGIKQIYPVEAPVWQIVKEEQPASSVERGWFLIINDVRKRIVGIGVNKLVNLCKTVGMTVFKVRTNYIGVQTPNGESPTELVNAAIKADKEAEKIYEENMRKQGARIIRRPPTPIMTASQLVYADSDGSLFKGSYSTLRTLLSNPNIDSTRTYCNNVHEIAEVLGLEAARSFLIKEFSDVIGYEGQYINPRHIELLVDFMTSLGKVNGITFTGVSRQPIGTFEKASFQKAMDTFEESSGFGAIDEIKGTSASIYVGKRALIGTGFSDQYMDRSKLKQVEKEIELNPDMKLDIGSFKDALDEMTDIISGADIMVMEGAEEEMFAGEAMELPGGSVAPNIEQTPDPRVYQQIKGPMVRGVELEMAAIKLNDAPCLEGPPKAKVRVEDIKSPLRVEQLPFAGPTEVALPTEQKVSQQFTPGPLGLPEGLLTQMKQFQYSEQVSAPPAIGLPSTLELPPIAPVETAIQFQPEQSQTKTNIVFDLEGFMK